VAKCICRGFFELVFADEMKNDRGDVKKYAPRIVFCDGDAFHFVLKFYGKNSIPWEFFADRQKNSALFQHGRVFLIWTARERRWSG